MINNENIETDYYIKIEDYNDFEEDTRIFHNYFIYCVNIVSICFICIGTIFLLLACMYTFNKPDTHYLQRIYNDQSNILCIFSITCFSLSLILFVFILLYKYIKS